MLIPRFSLRWLLLATTICGVGAYFVSQAIAGEAWGVAVAAAGAVLLLGAVFHSSVFLLAWGIAEAAQRRRQKLASSPFATDVKPPQILPPQDPV